MDNNEWNDLKHFYSQNENDEVYLSRKQNNMIYLRGRVQFPTGGDEMRFYF
jgi:hypothetical protein